MKIIVSGGGTGGHIYPALALIKRLQQRELLDDVLYVGTKSGLEERIIEREHIAFQAIKIQGFKRKLSWNTVQTLYLFINSIKKSKQIIRDFQPDVVVGTGGYVSSSVVFAAHLLKVPTVIHEQNSVAGLTNKFLGHFVDKIAYAFTDVKDQFSEKKKLVFTGNPRAQEVADLKPNLRLADFGLQPQVPTVMIFGGSRGAAPINKTTIASLTEFSRRSYQVLFVTGRVHYENVQKQIKTIQLGNNVKIVPYIDDMPTILPDMALVVGRSGATSIAELTALGVPSVFIPSPYVTHDHQTKNAQSLVKNQAALMIPEEKLTSAKLLQTVDQILSDSKLQTKLATNSRKLGVPDASDRLITVLENLIKTTK